MSTYFSDKPMIMRRLLNLGTSKNISKIKSKMEEPKNSKVDNDLILPHQPYHDDFLQTMAKVFKWSRWLGVVGMERGVWKLWGFLLLCLLVTIEVEAIWKVVKALAGWAIDIAGKRSVTARLAGTMFYAAALLQLLQCWRFSSSWNDIRKYWASVEWVLNIKYVPQDTTLKKKMYIIIATVIVCTTFEHTLSILSIMDFHCEPSLCFRKFIMASHGFMLLEDEYSDWIGATLLFVSIIATILWNLQDLIIILTSKGLTSRYKRLNECVAKFSAKHNQEKGPTEDPELLKVYLWRKIREAYVKQTVLVRRVDKSLGGLIVVSTFFNFYFICLHLFLSITQSIPRSPIKASQFMVLMIWLFVRTVYTVISAADVNKYSTLALPHLYACQVQFYNIEIERLQKQLVKDYVALSGMGFFYINRTVLLQISGAIVTYVLVLVQYDRSDQ